MKQVPFLKSVLGCEIGVLVLTFLSMNLINADHQRSFQDESFTGPPVLVCFTPNPDFTAGVPNDQDGPSRFQNPYI